MNFSRRAWIATSLAAALWTAGCVATPSVTPSQSETAAARTLLAPSGKLRVGVYMGSPTSMVQKTGQARAGVSYELGQVLARSLDVPYEVVEFKRVAEIVAAIQRGDVDFTVTNASAARAQLVGFSEPILSLELGYLVPANSPLTQIADVDNGPHRIGVSQGSSSEGVLSRAFKQARVMPQASIPVATRSLQQGQLDAFATNKAILHAMKENLPGARVLEGRWGLEHMAIAIPKNRISALPYLNRFAQTVKSDGQLRQIIERSGLQGSI